MNKILLLLCFLSTTCGQDITYIVITPTNQLSWSTTNITGTIQGYTIQYGTNAVLKSFKTTQNSVPFSSFLNGTPYGLVNINISVTVNQNGNVIETMLSPTNSYFLWAPTPSVPGGTTGVVVK